MDDIFKEPIEYTYFRTSDGTEYQFLYAYDDCDECEALNVKTGERYRLPYYYNNYWAFYCHVPSPEDQRLLDLFWNKYLTLY